MQLVGAGPAHGDAHVGPALRSVVRLPAWGAMATGSHSALVPNHLPDDVEVVLHAENGILGVGNFPDDQK